MVRIKGWKKDKGYEDGYAWNSNKKMILIADGQFGGFTTHIWQHTPGYKDLSRRNFKTLKQAQNYAKNYMRGHPSG